MILWCLEDNINSINFYKHMGGKIQETKMETIDEYSKKLVIEVGKKYNKRTLFRMKQFYNMFKDEKVSLLATQLTWSHYTELLSIKDINKLTYYMGITIIIYLKVR